MAVVQAVANHDLAVYDGMLLEATACLKRGIKYTGLLFMRSVQSLCENDNARKCSARLDGHDDGGGQEAVPLLQLGLQRDGINGGKLSEKKSFILTESEEGTPQYSGVMDRHSSMTRFNKVTETGDICAKNAYREISKLNEALKTVCRLSSLFGLRAFSSWETCTSSAESKRLVGG
ncbi:hypothetical protein GQ600_26483 [Phytophthora cactorum]|nr:hypothetical protein GQ600_26483 [Phytophthora cactorum]